MSLETVDVLGFRLVNATSSQAASAICDRLDSRTPQTILFLNPHSIVVSHQDAQFRAAARAATTLFCDGVGLSLACRLLARRGVHRVYGFDLFTALSRELSQRRSGRVFFLGGDQAMLKELMARYVCDYPGIEAVGWHCPQYQPEFSPADLREMAAIVAEFRADVLWVGLGSPKQEKILHQLSNMTAVPCGAAIGAVFDFYSGRVHHAPAWIRRLGLQWLHRLLLEPRRLWRRTFISGPVFVGLVLREWLR